MEQRILGDGLKVSAIGYSCMGLSHAYGPALEKSVAIQRIREAYEYHFPLCIWGRRLRRWSAGAYPICTNFLECL